MNDHVNVLGTEYSIVCTAEDKDERLKDCDGYADWTVKRIVIDDFEPKPGHWEDCGVYKRKVLRHEIIHAFLFECGLHENTNEANAWAKNEEMVDWIARQHEKLHKAFEEAGAL